MNSRGDIPITHRRQDERAHIKQPQDSVELNQPCTIDCSLNIYLQGFCFFSCSSRMVDCLRLIVAVENVGLLPPTTTTSNKKCCTSMITVDARYDGLQPHFWYTYVLVCLCVLVCVRACVRACACVCFPLGLRVRGWRW